VTALRPPSLDDARRARERIRGLAREAPVVPLVGDGGETVCSLKLECLQDTGSFKVRGAGNAARGVADAGGGSGVYTLSAGNMGAALARAAQLVGASAAVVVPDNAPAPKLAAIERWGAELTAVPYDDWWSAVIAHGWEPLRERSFVHPFADERVMAGNATIALELVEQLPDVEEVFCAYGGGGLICGIAAALKALRPGVRIVAAEVETAAPLTASFAAGRPTPVDYRATFVDGCGSRSVADEMWPLASALIDDTVVVRLDEVAAAVRLLAERCHVVAEGAGAVPVAAARRSARHGERSVCIVSGGNIAAGKLTTILGGDVP
jgi:threonine dehydratase